MKEVVKPQMALGIASSPRADIMMIYMIHAPEQVARSKGGKRHERAARMSWQTACELGFRGTLGEWERLLGAQAQR
ncbi:MAG TPA: hypothetical protein VFD18_01625 [Chthoniobacterales bacterium]|nr:hypothetical protein [Chthoniobacterales bacterium]